MAIYFKSNKSSLLHNLITSQKEEALHHGTKNFNTSKGPASSFIREVKGGGPNTELRGTRVPSLGPKDSFHSWV